MLLLHSGIDIHQSHSSLWGPWSSSFIIIKREPYPVRVFVVLPLVVFSWGLSEGAGILSVDESLVTTITWFLLHRDLAKKLGQ